MRPTRRDPCKTCGHFLIEHEGKPFDVQCGYCAMTPPTTEYRRTPKVVCKNCIFAVGMFVGGLLVLGLQALR